MAPNGGTSRKTPAASSKASKMDDADDASMSNLFEGFEGARAPKLKQDIKENLPIVKKPGNWDSEVVNGDKTKASSDRSAALAKVPPSLARAFPDHQPMGNKQKVLKCNHCKRPVLEHAMLKHVESCLNKIKEKQRKKKEAKEARDAAARKEKGQGDSDDEVEGVGSKTAMNSGAGKKRKALDDVDDGGPSKKKKKKDEPKAKAGKPKAPVDVERQCGVELPQGGQCARSLTCKSHSMGAKRAVPGRSAPYDKLLMEYQRKNQAKLQKAAMDANAPNPEDDALPSGPVDQDEEKDAVMASLARAWGGQPLVQRTMVPLRRKYEYNRMKGMLASALGGRNGGSLFGTAGAGAGAGLLSSSMPREPTVDADGIVHPRRGSVVPGARSMVAPAASRKPSIASVGA